MPNFMRSAALLAALAITPFTANAGIIAVTQGNDAPGFSDGDIPGLFPDLVNAQSGQPAPFNAGSGSDPVSNLSESWTFNFAAITDPILSATLTLGIADHDSAASGSQVDSYSLDGNDLTAGLDTAFEGSGGSDGEYNVYQLDVLALATELTDGSATVALALQGPGLQTALFGGGVSETAFNGAHLIFSTLTIEFQDPTQPPVPTPAPGSGLLLVLGFTIAAWRRRQAA